MQPQHDPILQYLDLMSYYSQLSYLLKYLTFLTLNPHTMLILNKKSLLELPPIP